jgi:hypothetical protein
MRAQRKIWKVVGAKQPSNIEQLDLAAVNRCIEALEKAEADPRDIEVLTTHALTLAERIDEMRWLNPAKALDWLFEQAIPQRPKGERAVQGLTCASGDISLRR